MKIQKGEKEMGWICPRKMVKGHQTYQKRRRKRAEVDEQSLRGGISEARV